MPDPSRQPTPQSPTFEQRYDSIVLEINKRRPKWRLASVSFDDVRQQVLVKVHLKYDMFDPAKIVKGRPVEFSHWVNRVITYEIRNILRNNHTIYSRPCVQGCPWNTGADTCEKTKSGLQCDECPIYKSWRERKESHFNVKQTLPLENHMREVDGSPANEFIDIEESKAVIDRYMRDKLTKHEWRIYKALYIQHKSEREVGKALGYKKPKTKMFPGYLTILKLKKRFVVLAKEIIEEKNLA